MNDRFLDSHLTFQRYQCAGHSVAFIVLRLSYVVSGVENIIFVVRLHMKLLILQNKEMDRFLHLFP